MEHFITDQVVGLAEGAASQEQDQRPDGPGLKRRNGSWRPHFRWDFCEQYRADALRQRQSWRFVIVGVRSRLSSNLRSDIDRCDASMPPKRGSVQRLGVERKLRNIFAGVVEVGDGRGKRGRERERGGGRLGGLR